MGSGGSKGHAPRSTPSEHPVSVDRKFTKTPLSPDAVNDHTGGAPPAPMKDCNDAIFD